MSNQCLAFHQPADTGDRYTFLVGAQSNDAYSSEARPQLHIHHREDKSTTAPCR
jgi:hypothetical protein